VLAGARCDCVAVWPAPTTSSDSSCQRRCRDTSQQTNLSELQPDAHSTDRRQASPSPRIKSEHLSPPMTSSSRDHLDRLLTSSYSVTSRGTSPLGVTQAQQCPGDDGSRVVVSQEVASRRDHPLSLSISTQPYGASRCDKDGGGGSTGRTNSNPVTPCLSSLGYEIECITPVDEEPAPLVGQEQVLNSGEDGLSGLDVLSCVASSQVHEACTTCPRRRFSILELPLSQFIDAADDNDDDDDGRKTPSSPDVISAGYNVPSAGDCTVSSESMTRVIQQQNAANETSTEQRAGDVFTALKVDVGQSSCLSVFYHHRHHLRHFHVAL